MIRFIKESKTKEIKVVESKMITEMWHSKVQDNYSSLEELCEYDEIYGILERINQSGGSYETCEDLWNDNPEIQGSTDPKDFGLKK